MRCIICTRVYKMKIKKYASSQEKNPEKKLSSNICGEMVIFSRYKYETRIFQQVLRDLHRKFGDIVLKLYSDSVMRNYSTMKDLTGETFNVFLRINSVINKINSRVYCANKKKSGGIVVYPNRLHARSFLCSVLSKCSNI